MERVPVVSTNIRSVGYEPGSLILEVEFNSGTVYQYFDVAPAEYDRLMNAASKGKYLNGNIKGRYRDMRVR
jgi:hypothetical protein